MNRSSDVDMFISRLSRTCHAPFVLAVIDSYASDPRSAIRGQRMATTESPPVEMDILKAKLAKVEARKTQGAIVRSRTRWYEYGEKNSKYFYSLEKTNYRRKHVASIKTQEDKKITDPKKILQAEENFFKQIYTSVNLDPQLPEFSDFFEGIEKRLSEEEAETCKSEVTRQECYNALKSMAKNKSPGSDGFTVEFYLHFWNIIAK